jgi:Rrf2 family transcriptional regulator, iron-sulfur cluster assembly transcription factor
VHIRTLTRYGVRAVFDIAYHGCIRPVQAKDISKRQKISQRYLEQIFHKLVKSGLLRSTRGPTGGYVLSRDPAEITVGDIIKVAQGPILPVPCVNGNKENCEIFPKCVTRQVWLETQRLLVDYFDSVTIADLCTLARNKGLHRDFEHSLDYYI